MGVTVESLVGVPSARQRLFSEPQLDDSGADTLDRYNWQASMAAADGLRLYLDSLDGDGRPSKDIDSRIVCELQEDWAAVDGDAVELVSAKHRDVTTGPFTTVNALADSRRRGSPLRPLERTARDRHLSTRDDVWLVVRRAEARKGLGEAERASHDTSAPGRAR